MEELAQIQSAIYVGAIMFWGVLGLLIGGFASLNWGERSFKLFGVHCEESGSGWLVGISGAILGGWLCSTIQDSFWFNTFSAVLGAIVALLFFWQMFFKHLPDTTPQDIGVL